MDNEEYEAQRQANIAANRALLNDLGIAGLTKKQVVKRIVKPKTIIPTDRVTRISSGTYARRSYTQIASPLYRETKRGSSSSTSDSYEPVKKRRGTSLISFIESESEESQKGKDEDDYEPSTKTIDRQYRPISMLLRKAQRLGHRRHDPKRFGPIPDVPVGTWWASRMECSTDAVHAPVVAGISGGAREGCYSIALSGGYADDIDLGESFTYTGSGGTKLQGMVNGKRLNLRTAPQTSDQSFKDDRNAALLTSSKTKRPIRVIRGFKNVSQYAPVEGYIYSGLYECTKAWMADGLNGFKVCKYAFKRLPNQDPLPTPRSCLTPANCRHANCHVEVVIN